MKAFEKTVGLRIAARLIERHARTIRSCNVVAGRWASGTDAEKQDYLAAREAAKFLRKLSEG